MWLQRFCKQLFKFKKTLLVSSLSKLNLTSHFTFKETAAEEVKAVIMKNTEIDSRCSALAKENLELLENTLLEKASVEKEFANKDINAEDNKGEEEATGNDEVFLLNDEVEAVQENEETNMKIQHEDKNEGILAEEVHERFLAA